MKLHQILLAGIRVLLVIEVFVVVHVPTHLLLVIQGALRGRVTSVDLLGLIQFERWRLSYSTYFSENGVDVLPQGMIVLDGFTDFSHLLQHNRPQTHRNEQNLLCYSDV